jgi:hypothetical protein
MQSLAATIPELIKYGVSYDIMTLNKESIISRARNTLAATFLKHGADYLFFIDADEGWDPTGFLRMLAAEKEIVGAAAPRKEFPITFCANLPEGPIQSCDKTGVISVNELGTGFMCIHKSVFEKMMEAEPLNFFYDVTTHERVYNFFEPRIIAYKFWSEDYTFCQNWRKLGGKVWLDPSVKLQHVGEHTWEGAFIQNLKRIEEPVNEARSINGHG